MRYAILADIHANLAAFTAVLADIEHRGGVAKIWCLGDTVGYGPDPHECLELLRQQEHIAVAGNHDWAAAGKLDISDFNTDAATACQWAAQRLSSADLAYLGQLPSTVVEGDFTLVHGSPREPIWEYLVLTDVAAENLAHFETPYCLVGHTHVPLLFRCNETGGCAGKQLQNNAEVVLDKKRLIFNPGGIGQPRDGDPRASYAIYDSETRSINVYRVPYDIHATQEKMFRYGLPRHLIARLSQGW